MHMHPELLNNSLFLRYYNRWREHPESIVFASVAEFFLMYDLVDDAVRVCLEGLALSPDAVLGRLVLAKAYLKQGKLDEAQQELGSVLDIVPSHSRAQQLLDRIAIARSDWVPIAFDDATGGMDEAGDEHTGDESENSHNGDEAAHDHCDVHHAEVFEDLPAWKTVTMAKILMSQGHTQKARAIYEDILAHDPANEAAMHGLHSLKGGN